VGKWRDVDEAFKPVDPSGALPNGTKFSDLAGFRAALLSHPERFVNNVTEKLLTFALGRGLEYYDMPAVRQIVSDASADDFRFASLIVGIVKSTPFQMRRSASTVVARASADQN
jgi:hypothetical protein